MAKLRFFRRTDLSTECDACGTRIDLITGGTCEQCRRILCDRHLHGSWWRRMVHEFKRPIVCVACRAGLNPSPPDRDYRAARRAAMSG